MKRIGWILVLALVLGVGASALAATGTLEGGATFTDTINVKVNLSHFAQVEISGNLIELDVDFSDELGFGKRMGYIDIDIKTNNDIGVSMSSGGFGNSTLNKLVAYYYPGYSESAHSFGANGHKGPRTFEWEQSDSANNGQISFRLEAYFSRTGGSEEVWHLIRSGEYMDTVTMTVSAAK